MSAIPAVRPNPIEYDRPWEASHAVNSWLAPAPSVRMSTSRPGRPSGERDGSCANASFVTVM